MPASFDALAGNVRRLRPDPRDGRAFVLVSRRLRRLKALWFHRSRWGAAGTSRFG
jgi:hypothetical protein